MRKNFSIAALLIIGCIFFTASAQAEMQTYEGIGEYWITQGETYNFAKQQAKKIAERDALEQVYVYVRSQSEVKNSELSKDEIITIAAGLLYVTDTKYSMSKADDFIVAKAIVIATIDTAAVVEAVEREKKARLQD